MHFKVFITEIKLRKVIRLKTKNKLKLQIIDPTCLYHCRIGIVRDVVGGRISVEYEEKNVDVQNFWLA